MQLAYGQWTISPILRPQPYTKPVAEDTLQVKDFYNSKYAERVGNTFIIGRDTILVEPLKCNTALKRLPQLSNDVKLLQQNLYYPNVERIRGVEGKCRAYLKINRRGKIDSVWVEQGLTKYMDNMIITAVHQLPRFKPARNKGKRVEAICYYRIRFMLLE